MQPDATRKGVLRTTEYERTEMFVYCLCPTLLTHMFGFQQIVEVDEAMATNLAKIA